MLAGASRRPAAEDKAAPPAKRGKKAAEPSAEEETGPSHHLPAEPAPRDPAPQHPAPKDAKEYPELPEDRMIACAMLQCRAGHDRYSFAIPYVEAALNALA